MKKKPPDMQRPITDAELEAAAAKAAVALQTSLAELRAPRGEMDLRKRRTMIIYWLRIYKNAKYPQIARVLHKQSHVGMIFAVGQARKYLNGKDREYSQELLSSILRGTKTK